VDALRESLGLDAAKDPGSTLVVSCAIDYLGDKRTRELAVKEFMETAPLVQRYPRIRNGVFVRSASQIKGRPRRRGWKAVRD